MEGICWCLNWKQFATCVCVSGGRGGYYLHDHCHQDDNTAANIVTDCLPGSNIAEALVSKGLARVVRYRQDDDQRSSHYDELLAAEARAEKKGVGLFSKKESPLHRVADIAGVMMMWSLSKFVENIIYA